MTVTTLSARPPVAGSHRISDHWEHKNLLILHGTDPDEPVLRVCIRGRDRGDSVWVDMKMYEADIFARCIFRLAGYEVGEMSSVDAIRSRSSNHWNVYTVGKRGRVRHKICIFHHGSPVSCRATHTVPSSQLASLAKWLAPRLAWDLHEELVA